MNPQREEEQKGESPDSHPRRDHGGPHEGSSGRRIDLPTMERPTANLVHGEAGSEAALVIISQLVDSVQKFRKTYKQWEPFSFLLVQPFLHEWQRLALTKLEMTGLWLRSHSWDLSPPGQ